jgi:hypothetical protein
MMSGFFPTTKTTWIEPVSFLDSFLTDYKFPSSPSIDCFFLLAEGDRPVELGELIGDLLLLLSSPIS